MKIVILYMKVQWRMEIPIGCCHLNREHIVPKSLHPQWTFLTKNLCLACDMCNEHKGTTEVLANPEIDEYPTESQEFKIVNPYLDRYSNHIQLLNDILYVALTEKGKFTINTCNLTRVDLAVDRAKLKMEQSNPESTMDQILKLMNQENVSDEFKRSFLQKIQNVIKIYRTKRHIG